MKDEAVNPPEKPRTNIALSCVLLTVALLVSFPAFALFGYTQHGMVGVVAAAVAGGVCWMGGLLALLLVGLVRGREQMVHATLLGMLFRTGLPLITGIVLTRAGGPLAEAGVFAMILVYYLIGLSIETVLSVRLIGAAQHVAKAS